MAEQTRKALIVVDVQNDFCPGGALAVPRGDEIVPIVNRLAARFHNVIRPCWSLQIIASSAESMMKPTSGASIANEPA